MTTTRFWVQPCRTHPVLGPPCCPPAMLQEIAELHERLRTAGEPVAARQAEAKPAALAAAEDGSEVRADAAYRFRARLQHFSRLFIFVYPRVAHVSPPGSSSSACYGSSCGCTREHPASASVTAAASQPTAPRASVALPAGRRRLGCRPGRTCQGEAGGPQRRAPAATGAGEAAPLVCGICCSRLHALGTLRVHALPAVHRWLSSRRSQSAHIPSRIWDAARPRHTHTQSATPVI